MVTLATAQVQSENRRTSTAAGFFCLHVCMCLTEKLLETFTTGSIPKWV